MKQAPALCTLCPRHCNVDRDKTVGFCGAPWQATVAKIVVHRYEEPVISGTAGSGAIFFAGCNLRCRYCQNGAISRSPNGRAMTPDALASAMLALQDDGVHNINLVTAAHFLPAVRAALTLARPRLTVPVVYNSSGYECAAALTTLEGLVDIFLPDAKYYDSTLSARLSAAPDYLDRAREAIGEMVRQQPRVEVENGLMRRGVLVRHLVLPGHRDDSIHVLREIKLRFPSVWLSLMWQYTPAFNDGVYPELNRQVTTFEYRSVLREARALGFDGFMQGRGSATTAYTPDFAEKEHETG